MSVPNNPAEMSLTILSFIGPLQRDENGIRGNTRPQGARNHRWIDFGK
jgi:hypothetical protein